MATFDYIRASDSDAAHSIRLTNSSGCSNIGISELATVLANPKRSYFTPFATVIQNTDMWKAIQYSFEYHPNDHQILVVTRTMEKHHGSEQVNHTETTQVYRFDADSIADMRTTIAVVRGFSAKHSKL